MNIHYTRLNVGPTCSPGALMAEHCPWPVAERDSRPSRAKLGRQIKKTPRKNINFGKTSWPLLSPYFLWCYGYSGKAGCKLHVCVFALI